MIIAIIILFICSISFIVITLYEYHNNGILYSLCPPILGIGIVICVGIISFSTPPIPEAIDVYNGKTELIITYKNNTPIDTVVVFKEEYKDLNKK